MDATVNAATVVPHPDLRPRSSIRRFACDNLPERLMKHRFATGQRVRLRPSHTAFPAGSGSFKIIAPLPIERSGEIRYRIKSEAENFERVADESNLSLTI